MSKIISTNQIRETFLEYFKAQGHEEVPSSSLIPGNDPTLLFTNAGMVQFKDVFLGHEQKSYTRATTSQCCVRAGGKHNDLENVGFTARHHTFFEMLGNFSFGDYFKREAIRFAWTLLTEKFALDPKRLWVTVFKDDQETADIWLNEMKIDPKRFSYCGEKDNFWSMGNTGPCGPCTEIFFDHGPNVAGGPPGSPDEDGDRYVEIWNIVFMQYNRDESGKLTPLPKPSVDTGMGLERIAAVLQGVCSNYEIDLFQAIIKATADITLTKDLNHQSLKVLADHIRSCSFLILDGVRPSNEGRGYVLRRIIRRAVRHGHKLGMSQPFFYQLVSVLAKQMSDAYPRLLAEQDTIEQTLLQEEKQFAETLQNGMALLQEACQNMEGDTLPGEVSFKLYDTYGFPLDLTADILRERHLKIDEAGFNTCMKKQRERSQAASQFKMSIQVPVDHKTEFTGYEHLQQSAMILNMFQSDEEVRTLNPGMEAILILDRTTFYAESGGQLGDHGEIQSVNNTGTFIVTDTQKQGDTFLHFGQLITGELHTGDKVVAEVDATKRQATRLNHSATHLLHAALQIVLGDHVLQKGSLVSPDRLRFDFSHSAPVTRDELYQIERLVNQHIRANHGVETIVTSQDEAKKMGAMALFGEKYGDTVRVLKMGIFSTEFCGGTHASATGDIGLFKIIHETGIAAGVRRLEALTGKAAIDFVEQEENQLYELASQLKTSVSKLPQRIMQLQEQVKLLEKQAKEMQAKMAGSLIEGLVKQVVSIGEINLLVSRVDEVDKAALRDLVDQLKVKFKNAVILLAKADDKVSLIAGVSKNITDKISAGKLVNHVAEQLGGKGGGRPDMAQAGAPNVEGLDQALKTVHDFVKAQV